MKMSPFSYICTWRDISCLEIGIPVVKLSVFPKLMYRYNTVPVKLLAIFFAETEKLIKKFTWIYKGQRIAKEFLKKKARILPLLYIKPIQGDGSVG